MPALTDYMYCSEQICIPPSFPYLLRQYAKAAIRTQPIDLLKWSTAYFRCLSLNIPPPVKPRLEYPIPRDFKGITPGWLKALMYQLQNNQTIPFKILWDRWIGACLQHDTLIQLLCIGGFEDAQAIPWLKFVAICAGTLSDDLSHTMILICEILTEEPEGGSAMICLETFIDLYTFLARIDASHDQTLRNYFFRDSLLSLWREKAEKIETKVDDLVELKESSEESTTTKSSSQSIVEEKVDDVDKVVSCPSLPEDDHYSIDYLLKEEPEAEEDAAEEEGLAEYNYGEQEGEGVMAGTKQSDDNENEATDEQTEKEDKLDKDEKKVDEEDEGGKEIEDVKDIEIREDDLEDKQKGEAEEKLEDKKEEPTESVAEVKQEQKEDKQEPSEVESLQEEDTVLSGETLDVVQVRNLDLAFEDDVTLREDLERLRVLQQEMTGETDEELEKFKCRLIKEMPLTESQEKGIKHFKPEELLDQSSSEDKLKISGINDLTSSDSTDGQETEKDKRPYDDVAVEAMPGIGGMVSDNLIKAVIDYMKGCAKVQHGMVMPRNIRHYSCPPLEDLNY